MRSDDAYSDSDFSLRSVMVACVDGQWPLDVKDDVDDVVCG